MGREIYSKTQLAWECFHLRSSEAVNQRLISFLAFSTESEPWQTLRPTSMAKSPCQAKLVDGVGKQNMKRGRCGGGGVLMCLRGWCQGQRQEGWWHRGEL